MALNLDSLGLSAKVTAEGISAPDYQTILSTLISYFQQIYGSDAYLEPDSKDGQMVALMALAIHDANNMAITVYNCFSPATGYGAALTSNVKINGISRKGATNSTVDLLLTGTAGTTIINGSVKDSNNVIWRLPASVVVGVDGTVMATAKCSVSGAVAALAGTITEINTPTRGWVSVTNPAAATVGSTAETDAELRIRQSQSVALPSITPFEALDGAVSNVTGVRRYGFSFGFAASICLTVSMGKNPVGKIILSTFYPSWSAAVNDLTRTITNCESTEGLIFRGFCGLVRMGAN